jgi:hypothetical protein
MTHDEMCDRVDGEWIGLILPGQSCQSRAGVPAYGCEVVTESIINTGCVSYGYTIGNDFLEAGYCVSVVSDVAGAMCESLTILDQVQQSYT